MLKALKHITAFIILTILTQIGGVVYLISLLLYRKLTIRNSQLKHWGISTAMFIILYLIFTLWIVPPIANLTGRTALPISSKKNHLKPLTPLTFLLNRHYVSKELKQTLIDVSTNFNKKHRNSAIQYLDANFPFFDGFPLIPHLSHNDGRKVDLAFFYYDILKQEPSGETPSYWGYGVYASPQKGEVNTAIRCKEKGYWQYDLLGKILPKPDCSYLVLDEKRTASLLELLAKEAAINKIFLEPHLKTRLLLQKVNKIRFHGCHAVRHDDHIHVQQ